MIKLNTTEKSEYLYKIPSGCKGNMPYPGSFLLEKNYIKTSLSPHN